MDTIVTNATFSAPLRAIIDARYRLIVCPNLDPSDADMSPADVAAVRGILLFARSQE